MADIDDDDDEFGSDDAFGDLPPNTLLQLEQQGSQFFQLPRQPATAYNSGLRNVVAQNQWNTQKQESFQSDRTVQPAPIHEQDYGYDDEDIVDLDQDPYALPRQYDQGRTLAGQLHAGVQGGAPTLRGQAQPGAPGNDTSLAELQARILELENDRTSLRKQVEDARVTAQSKAGEAAILRQKAEKAARDYEQKVATLRLQHAEERAKQNAELERVKTEREKLTTNNRFLEHDLAFEAGKNRQVQRTQRPDSVSERPGTALRNSPAVTPRKAKVLPYRDGFDDSDLVMLSPSKPRDRSKPNTPTKAGAKRKRTGGASGGGADATQGPTASPPPRLPLSEPKALPVAPHSGATDVKATADLLHRLSLEHNKLRFMQRLLQHHVNDTTRENIFEALTHFAFPSNPDRKLSTILYEQFTLQPQSLVGGNSRPPEGKSVSDQFCSILLSLWEQSLTESYYPPLPCLVSCTQRIFDLERFVFVRRYITRTTPLVVATADLVAIPHARASINKNQSPRTLAGARATSVSISKPAVAASNVTTQPRIGVDVSDTAALTQQEQEAKACIPVLPCLELLQTLASSAKPIGDAITLFWQAIRYDFVLLMLMNAQPIDEVVAMLELIRGSALEASFGTISGSGDEERQERRELDLIDRLTLMLNETFDPRREDVTPATVFEIREKVVDILHALVFLNHGASLLAHSRHAIGRLFKFLHTSINALYTHTHYSLSIPISRSINTTTTILYLLCSSTGSSQTHVSVDIRQKLAVVPGGMHVHLLALTRLAFAERIWYERGLEERTGEMAHEMLDEWLSPEEGEGLMMMFGSEGSEVP